MKSLALRALIFQNHKKNDFSLPHQVEFPSAIVQSLLANVIFLRNDLHGFSFRKQLMERGRVFASRAVTQFIDFHFRVLVCCFVVQTSKIYLSLFLIRQRNTPQFFKPHDKHLRPRPTRPLFSLRVPAEACSVYIADAQA